MRDFKLKNEISMKIMSKSTIPASSFFYDLLMRNIFAAELQLSRIWEEKPKPLDIDEAIKNHKGRLIDIHFYFIALRNIYRYLEKLSMDPIFKQLDTEVKSLNEKWFDHYKTARDSFEHFDERLPDQKKEAKIIEVEENGAKRKIHFGIKKEGFFTQSNEEWDIRLKTFNLIKKDVENIIQKMKDILDNKVTNF